MITINGQKMGKSLGNFITLDNFFAGSHPMLQQAYSPMTIRFFILQAHYRSTVDFSNEALQASEKAYNRLMEGWHNVDKLTPSDVSTFSVNELAQKCDEAMNDDLSTPIVISHLFDAVRIVNSVLAGKGTLTSVDIETLRETMRVYIFDILGLVDSTESNEGGNEAYSKAIDLLLDVRREAKARKDWAMSDFIRDKLGEIGFEIKDTKEGTEWKLK